MVPAVGLMEGDGDGDGLGAAVLQLWLPEILFTDKNKLSNHSALVYDQY